MREYLIISTNVELFRVASDDIMYISSDGNYSLVYSISCDSRVVTLQLGDVETLISQQLRNTGMNFVRIGRSMIINKMYVNYIHPNKSQLVLSDGHTASHTLNASKDALKLLKTLIEKDIVK